MDVCTCSETLDCDDGLFCTGMDYCLLDECLHLGDPCSTQDLHCDEDADECVCWYDNECDDELFCTGVETCSNGQCVSGANPCEDPYVCNENIDNCTLPDVVLDVEDSAGFISFSNVEVEITLNNSADKVGGVEFELCDENDYIAVTGCEPAPRVPGGMTCQHNPLTNGCDKILLFDPGAGGLYISKGSGTLLTMKYDVKGTCFTRGAQCSCNEQDCYKPGTECSVGDPGCYLLVHNECTGPSCDSGCYQLKEPCMHADTGCINLEFQNTTIFDENLVELGVYDKTGEFCIYCFDNEDCNNNQCTDDTCVSTACYHENKSGPCNDGLYCTEIDTCAGGQCIGSGNPCDPSYVCVEDNDTCVPCDPDDWDCDGVSNFTDNCYVTGPPAKDDPNGPLYGTCARTISGVVIGTGEQCTDDSECSSGGVCQKNQEDYNLNGVGDVCECYANIEDSDDEIGLFDLILMKTEYGSGACPLRG